MAFGSWVVGVFMRFQSNGTVVMERLAAQTDAANATLLRQQGLIDANEAAMRRYQRTLAEVRAEQLRTGTAFAGGVAAGGFAAMAYSVSQAAQLQRALTTIRLATGANGPQMDAIREAAYNISSATAQSVTQSAQILGVMAAAGINNPKQLLNIAMPAAKFADVQYLKSGGQVSFEDAARQAIQIAHLYQAYTPEKIKPILDTVTKLSFMMPDTLNKYLTQAGYYMPLFRRMGVSDEQSAVIGALLDRMGMGRGKGGTALQDFVIQSMNALQLTAHAQAGHVSALQKLGIIDEHGRNRFYTTDAHGKTTFDLFGELQQINKAIEEQTKGLHGTALTAKRSEFITDLLSAFKTQGGRAAFLATPEGIGQLLQMVHQLNTLPGMSSDQASYMGTLGGRFNQAVTNLRSVMTELGWPWLDDLTSFFKTLADKTHDFQAFLHHHKDLDRGIGAAVSIMTTMASARFGIGLVSAARGALGLGSAIQNLSKSLDAATARILKDEAAIDAGAAASGAAAGAEGAGGGAAVATAIWKRDLIGRGVTWIWKQLTFGISDLLVHHVINPLETSFAKWLVKGGTFISKFGGFADRFGTYVLTLGKNGDILVDLLGRVGLGLGGLIARLNPIVDILGLFAGTTAPAGEEGPLMGLPKSYWLKYQREHGGPGSLPDTVQLELYHRIVFMKRALNVEAPPSGGERFDRARRHEAQDVHVELELPHAVPKGTKVHARFKLQSILGSNPSSIALPKPLVRSFAR